jgi:hypothetical protein
MTGGLDGSLNQTRGGDIVKENIVIHEDHMRFWYRGKMWKPFTSYRFIKRGAKKGQVEVTFRLYGKEKKEIVHREQVRGIPETTKP